jgi:hypothetical protein
MPEPMEYEIQLATADGMRLFSELEWTRAMALGPTHPPRTACRNAAGRSGRAGAVRADRHAHRGSSGTAAHISSVGLQPERRVLDRRLGF